MSIEAKQISEYNQNHHEIPTMGLNEDQYSYFKGIIGGINSGKIKEENFDIGEYLEFLKKISENPKKDMILKSMLNFLEKEKDKHEDLSEIYHIYEGLITAINLENPKQSKRWKEHKKYLKAIKKFKS